MTTKKHILGLVALLGTFFLLLVSATTQIYHQDEYSWLKEMDKTSLDPHIHPPLYFLLGRAFGLLIGFGHERWLPALFAIVNIILVYVIANALTKRRGIGLLAAGLFAFNAYSIIAATQIDIDGALLPFFVLLTYFAYLRVLEKDKRWYWILGLAIAGGLLTKLSFLIGLAALAGDWSIRMVVEKNIPISNLLRQYWKWFLGGLIALGVTYLAMGYLLPGMVSYTLVRFKIFDFGHRAYLDLGFKLLKSLVLLGPFLLLGGLAVLWRPKAWYQYRFFWLYLILCTLFYAVIFDFTTLTIERYFMFMIAPFAILAAEPIAQFFQIAKDANHDWRVPVFSGGIVMFLFYILSLPSIVLPLNPKIAYTKHILSGHWNFLIPITGGSGPIGFYVSALFLAVAWGMALLAIIAIRSRRELIRVAGAVLFICVGIFTTIIILEEFLFGGIYGSPNRIAWETLNYVNANPAIHQQQVITYYDIANYDLRLSDKYYSRFYTAPTRDYTAKLTNFRGYYMVVDFPTIGKDTLYWQLLQRCPIIKQFSDKEIHSYIFDCHSLLVPKK